MDLGLKGKKAIVTGATRGIGRAIAAQLAAEGADVAICARQDAEVADAVEQLKSSGSRIIGEVLDITDAAAYQAWVPRAAEQLGGLDIFIPTVSAGGGQMDEPGWRANFEVDVLGTTRGITAALPLLQQSSAAAIVVIGSVAATEDFMGPQTYNAMKAALIAHAGQLAMTYAPMGIRVNCISPGPVHCAGGIWDYIQANLPDIYDMTKNRMPRGSLGTPDEVARAAVFLASPAASLVTGTNLIVDGGFTKRVQF